MARTRTSASASAIVGEELRRARRERGITQAELAAKMSVSPPFIAQLESGRANPTIGQIGEVARALGAGLEINLVVLDEWKATGLATPTG